MGQTRVAWILVTLGVALVAVSAFADPIGLGDGDGIGWKQGAGMVVGAVIVLAGLGLRYRTKRETGSSQAAT
jgi:hypothetical protein